MVSVPPLDVNTMRCADCRRRDVDRVVAGRAVDRDRVEVQASASEVADNLDGVPPPALPGVGVVVTVAVLTRISSISLSSAMMLPMPVPFRVMTISVAAGQDCGRIDRKERRLGVDADTVPEGSSR